MASLSAADMAYVTDLVYRESAIVLEAGKEYLVETRLARIVRDEGLASIGDLVTRLRGSSATALHGAVVEAMTTNETSFFRDAHPFDALRTDVLPALIERRASQRALSIWSAACSSGQEAYSIAMLLREHFPALAGWRLRIYGTDLSQAIVERAREGRYRGHEVNRGLPSAMLVKYFEQQGSDWVVRAPLRELCEFSRGNLLGTLPVPRALDVVFLRNVLIYFDLETRRTVLRRVRDLLAPDGWLALGGVETTLGIDESWHRVALGRSSFYRPSAEPAAVAAGARVSPWPAQRDRA